MGVQKFVFTLITIVFFTTTTRAEGGSISGIVHDAQGPIAGVSVRLVEIPMVTRTDSLGHFAFSDISSGHYTLETRFPSYQIYRQHIDLHTDPILLDTIMLREDCLQLDQVVVTGTRSEVLRKNAPIACSVLDEKIFSATQSITLAEGLSFQPALRLENNCQNCGFNSLRMNGLEGAYSQILIDGRPIYSSLQGVYGLEQIPANMIERVEIIRSGGSALYGSSAIAGTVNIITKEPTQNDYYLSTNQAALNGQTTDQTYMLGATVLHPEKRAGITVNGFTRNRGAYDNNGDGYSEIGMIKAQALSFKTYYRPSMYSKITASGYSIYEHRRGGNKFDMPYHETDITEATTHNILNGGLTYEQYSHDQKHKFSLYTTAQKLKRDSYYGSHHDPNAYGVSTENSMVSGLQYSGELGELLGGSHTLVSGLEHNYSQLKDAAPSYDRYISQTIDQLGFYLQDTWDIRDRLVILLGGRLDHHSLVSTPILSPRVNALYKITPELNFRVGYARGYRAPQVFDEDLHITQVGGGGTVVRNADHLKPEFSQAYSTSLDYNKYFDDWAIGMSIDGFYTRLDQVFVLEELGQDAQGNLLLERRNQDAATVSGITLSPTLQYKDRLNIQLGYTLQKSIYDVPVQWSETTTNNDKRFLRTPDQYGFYVASFAANKRFSINLSGVYTGSMLVQHYAGYISQDRLESTPDFFEHNIKLRYTLPIDPYLQLTISGGVQNYTNAYQRDFDLGIDRDAGYIYGPSRPSTYFISLRLHL